MLRAGSSPEEMPDLRLGLVGSHLHLLRLGEVDGDGGGGPGGGVGDDGVTQHQADRVVARLRGEVSGGGVEIELELVVLVGAGLGHVVDLGAGGDVGEADEGLVDRHGRLGGRVEDGEGEREVLLVVHRQGLAWTDGCQPRVGCNRLREAYKAVLTRIQDREGVQASLPKM